MPLQVVLRRWVCAEFSLARAGVETRPYKRNASSVVPYAVDKLPLVLCRLFRAIRESPLYGMRHGGSKVSLYIIEMDISPVRRIVRPYGLM